MVVTWWIMAFWRCDGYVMSAYLTKFWIVVFFQKLGLLV